MVSQGGDAIKLQQLFGKLGEWKKVNKSVPVDRVAWQPGLTDMRKRFQHSYVTNRVTVEKLSMFNSLSARNPTNRYISLCFYPALLQIICLFIFSLFRQHFVLYFPLPHTAYKHLCKMEGSETWNLKAWLFWEDQVSPCCGSEWDSVKKSFWILAVVLYLARLISLWMNDTLAQSIFTIT